MTANIISTHHSIYYCICIQHCPIIDFLFRINYSETKSLVRFVCNKFRITRQYFHAITKIDIVEIKCRIYEKKKKKIKKRCFVGRQCAYTSFSVTTALRERCRA